MKIVNGRVEHCEYCDIAPGHPVHGPYHDYEYGYPIEDNARLFERLVLEINQAGLSWLIVLRKRSGFYDAFQGYDTKTIARWGARQQAKLLSDKNIIRNRKKIAATIENAGRIEKLRTEFGGFHAWLLQHHPRTRQDWIALFRKTFVFTGGEITAEFLMSTGFLPGAHQDTCPVFKKLSMQPLRPYWMQVVEEDPLFYDS